MTSRLVASAIDDWDSLEGYATAHNMPYLADLPLDRFTSFVYWMLTRNGDPKEVEKFRKLLWQPPVSASSAERRRMVSDSRSPWNPAREGEGLSAFKKQMTGGPVPRSTPEKGSGTMTSRAVDHPPRAVPPQA